MKQIELTQGKWAIVDDEDYERLSRWKWRERRSGNIFYAVRTVGYRKTDGKWSRTMAYLHHEIIGKPANGFVTDHINGNGLDNRRENLRHCTCRENSQNLHIEKSSRFPGVHWITKDCRWRAQIRIDGKQWHIGDFKHELDAANSYDDVCQRFVNVEKI